MVITSVNIRTRASIKTQNVANARGTLDNISSFGDTSNENVCQDLKLSSVLKICETLNTGSIWHQIFKDHVEIIYDDGHFIIVA